MQGDQSHPLSHIKFKVSVGYRRPWEKRETKWNRVYKRWIWPTAWLEYHQTSDLMLLWTQLLFGHRGVEDVSIGRKIWRLILHSMESAGHSCFLLNEAYAQRQVSSPTATPPPETQVQLHSAHCSNMLVTYRARESPLTPMSGVFWKMWSYISRLTRRPHFVSCSGGHG